MTQLSDLATNQYLSILDLILTLITTPTMSHISFDQINPIRFTQIKWSQKLWADHLNKIVAVSVSPEINLGSSKNPKISTVIIIRRQHPSTKFRYLPIYLWKTSYFLLGMTMIKSYSKNEEMTVICFLDDMKCTHTQPHKFMGIISSNISGSYISTNPSPF